MLEKIPAIVASATTKSLISTDAVELNSTKYSNEQDSAEMLENL